MTPFKTDAQVFAEKKNKTVIMSNIFITFKFVLSITMAYFEKVIRGVRIK